MRNFRIISPGQFCGRCKSRDALTEGRDVLPVNHRRYWWPGYYPYYSYPAYSYYAPYYGPPAVVYPPPVVYYPGPRYYPGSAVYGAYGGFVVGRPYGSYYTDW